MDETISERFSKTLQDLTVRYHRKESVSSHNHSLGCDLHLIHLLHQNDQIKKEECNVSNAEGISYEQIGVSAQLDCEYGIETEIPTENDKHYKLDQKQQDRKVHVRSVSSLNTTPFRNNEKNDEGNATEDSEDESKEDENISMDMFCPNGKRIRWMQTSMGKLLRIGTVGGIERTKCKFVQPYDKYKEYDESKASMCIMQEGCSLEESRRSCDNSMVIEMFASESNRKQVADSVNQGPCEVSDLKDCIDANSALNDYVNEVQSYGFNHIILIGERDYGIIFFDCYGRVFELDTMSDALWPLGNSLEEATTKYWTGEVAWGVEDDGTVFEFKYYGRITEDQEDQKPQKVKKVQKKIQKNKRKKKKNKKNNTFF
ncbi:hypothetical protein C1645_742289 [Glomus cerebriforme]|uniref:Uncharacterized protein n=1 Tax=Glomus cerebriforme TaxID=658196 RepID=A0A397SIK5_9GLOM|nr:hypothetical protein C1645_742289 [Glomus cerebriforme]